VASLLKLAGDQLVVVLSPGVALLMAEVMPYEPLYAEAIQQFCNWYIPPLRTVPHTANGLAFPYKVLSARRPSHVQNMLEHTYQVHSGMSEQHFHLLCQVQAQYLDFEDCK